MKPVFGVDRVPDPWQPTWEDGSLLSTEELRELEEAEEIAEAAVAAMMPDRNLAFDPVELRGDSGEVVAVRTNRGWCHRQGLRRGALDGINEGSL